MKTVFEFMGARIRQLRLEAGLTQRRLAQEVGIHASYIGPLERGTRQPSLALLVELGRVLGVPARSFFPIPSNQESDVVQRVVLLLEDRSPEEQAAILDVVQSSLNLLITPPRPTPTRKRRTPSVG